MNRKTIPKNIYSIIYDSINKEEIIFSNKYFLVVKDLKYSNSNKHYTAWSKYDVNSLLEINFTILERIYKLKKKLINKNIINSNYIVYIHYPPDFWRLHIHFLEKFDKNHIGTDVIYINDIFGHIYSKL